jgi:formyltetrahydrofolate-dependent phosphoribosylglycinamide formyltransferase
MGKSRLVVLISGSGSNLQAILDACAADRLAAEVALVVSNRRAAYGLTRAEKAAVPTLYFPLKPYRDADQSRSQYDADLASRIEVYKPDLVVLAGWMHVLSPAFLDRYPKKVINLHPALPGMFAGTQAIERAYQAYREGRIAQTGCMVHHVIPEVDAGAVVTKAIVPILPQDSLADLEARMHETEHRIIVEAVRQTLLGG